MIANDGSHKVNAREADLSWVGRLARGTPKQLGLLCVFAGGLVQVHQGRRNIHVGILLEDPPTTHNFGSRIVYNPEDPNRVEYIGMASSSEK